MALTAKKALGAAKKFTKDTVIGLGALKGANLVVDSIVYNDVDMRTEVNVSWTGTDGSSQSGVVYLPYGVGIKSVRLDDAEENFIFTNTDGVDLDPVPLPEVQVKISKAEGNALVQKDDGLYVGETGVKISEAENNQLEEKADGLYVHGVSISEADANQLEEKDDGLYVPETAISEAEGNILERKDDGLYASADKIKISEKADNILTNEDDGLYVPSLEVNVSDLNDANKLLNIKVGDTVDQSVVIPCKTTVLSANVQQFGSADSVELYKYADGVVIYSQSLIDTDSDGVVVYDQNLRRFGNVKVNDDGLTFTLIGRESEFSFNINPSLVAEEVKLHDEGFNIVLYEANEDYGVYIDINDVVSDITREEFDTLAEKVANLELYKFPNAIIHGEPVINNGQISGFSADNYLAFPFIIDFGDRNFTIDMAFTTGDDVVTQQNIIDGKFGLALAIKNNHFLLAISSNGTSWDLGAIEGTYTVLPNTNYYLRLSFNLLQYKLSYSLDKVNYVDDIIKVATLRPYPVQTYIGVGDLGTSNPKPFLGIINMNHSYLTVRSTVVWQGMDDVGLATRLAVDLDNIDDAGVAKIKDIVSDDLATKVDIQQNVDDAGKALIVDEDGRVIAKEITIDTSDIEEHILNNWQGTGYNLIPYPYYFERLTGSKIYTNNGLTSTIHEDGSITTEGTTINQGSGGYNLGRLVYDKNIPLEGKEYRLIPNDTVTNNGVSLAVTYLKPDDSTSTVYYQINGKIDNKDMKYVGITNISIYLSPSVVAGTYINQTIRPMLVEVNEDGSYPTEYQRYALGNTKLTDMLDTKVDIQQSVDDAGKVLSIGEDGKVIAKELNVDTSVIEQRISSNWQNTGYNLIPYPYYHKSRVNNGVTFTVNEDGTVLVDGTATANAFLDFVEPKTFKVKKGTYKILSGETSEGFLVIWNIDTNKQYNELSGVFTFDEDATCSLYIYIPSGKTISNALFYPMLVKVNEDGSYPTEYQRYALGNVELTDTKADNKIVSDNWNGTGYNLIPYPYRDRGGSTHRGMTFTYDSDGVVTVDGKPDNPNPSTMSCVDYYYLVPGTYALIPNSKNKYLGGSIYLYDGKSSTQKYSGGYSGLNKNSTTQDVYIFTTQNGSQAIPGNLYDTPRVFTIDKDAYAHIHYRSLTSAFTGDNYTDTGTLMLVKVNEDGSYPTEYQRYALGNVKLTDKLDTKADSSIILKDNLFIAANFTMRDTDTIKSVDNGDGTYTINTYLNSEGKFVNNTPFISNENANRLDLYDFKGKKLYLRLDIISGDISLNWLGFVVAKYKEDGTKTTVYPYISNKDIGVHQIVSYDVDDIIAEGYRYIAFQPWLSNNNVYTDVVMRVVATTEEWNYNVQDFKYTGYGLSTNLVLDLNPKRIHTVDANHSVSYIQIGSLVIGCLSTRGRLLDDWSAHMNILDDGLLPGSRDVSYFRLNGGASLEFGREDRYIYIDRGGGLCVDNDVESTTILGYTAVFMYEASEGF